MCCQFEADEDQLEADGDTFDCETCPVAAHLTALDADNERAWTLTHTICTRFLGDASAVGIALNRLTSDLDPEAFGDLLARITLIYDILCPPPATSQT